MCDLFLKKAKVRQQTEGVFIQKQPSEGFFKKDVTRILAEFTRKNLCRNLFFEVFLWILRLICAKSVTY